MFTSKNSNRDWEPLIWAFEQLVGEVVDGKSDSFILSLMVEGYSPFPYLQGALNQKGDLVVEVVSDEFLEPDHTLAQKAWLKSLGWVSPDSSNPNYSRSFLVSSERNLLAKQLVATLRVVFNLQRNAWMSFGTSDSGLKISESQKFWHYVNNSEIVCLPEQNKTLTLEGILAA